jgi:hypothetical protein
LIEPIFYEQPYQVSTDDDKRSLAAPPKKSGGGEAMFLAGN